MYRTSGQIKRRSTNNTHTHKKHVKTYDFVYNNLKMDRFFPSTQILTLIGTNVVVKYCIERL